MPERCNSIANALQLHLSCTKPSSWCTTWKSRILIRPWMHNRHHISHPEGRANWSNLWVYCRNVCMLILGCIIAVWSWRCSCLVTHFCYQLIANPGNKTAPPPDPSHIKYAPLPLGLIPMIKIAVTFMWCYSGLQEIILHVAVMLWTNEEFIDWNFWELFHIYIYIYSIFLYIAQPPIS